MKIVKILLIIFLGYFSSFSYAQSCYSIHSVQWLLGHWVADDGGKITTEWWKEVSPLTFEGMSETRTEASNQLLRSESLRLVEMSGEVFYLPKVEENDLPVAFKLTQCSGSSAVFENFTHDFPNKLEYHLDRDNTLTVTVSDGKDKGFTINFIKHD
jgi:Domain of unknown function (DUF6265)